MSTYVSSDWHGNLWVWEYIKEILKPNDILYFLGDAADRGHDGWTIIKQLIDDKRVIYLKGNHEDLMVKAIGNSKLSLGDYYFNKDLELWYWNGGQVTHKELINDNLSKDKKIEYLQKIKELPFCCVYHNQIGFDILLSHAGCDNMEDANEWPEKDFLWDRSHYLIANSWLGKDNEIIIHGHTPIPYLLKDQAYYTKSFKNDIIESYRHGAYWYAQGHKACIDTGVIFTNETVLLNLDTFEEIIIKKGDDKNENHKL